MEFSHPLARGAKVWPVRFSDGKTQNVLVVATTMNLDPENKRYKAKLVERLSEAVKDFLSEVKTIDGFILVNRVRDWHGHRT